MENLRRLDHDDPSNSAGSLLTLPLSDFPGAVSSSANDSSQDNDNGPHGDNYDDDDGLLLIRLPPHGHGQAGGLTIDDLVRGESVYILGDSSEGGDDDAIDHARSRAEGGEGRGGDGDGGIGSPAARLIVEGEATSAGGRRGDGKTMELTRVETSNTYVVVPPIVVTATSLEAAAEEGDDRYGSGSAKRRRLADGGGANMVTMPARSVGLVPGEESPSCFFLDPAHLGPGHFSARLRAHLGRWTYDPFDPPPAVDEGAEGGSAFGCTIAELARACRTSMSEIERAIRERSLGAEDALAIPTPSGARPSAPARYGMLSEEGRQTVAGSIVSVLLESDLVLAWDVPTHSRSLGGVKDLPLRDLPVRGMRIRPLMEEIRAHWHRSEGEGIALEQTTPQNEASQLTDSLSASQSQTESQSQFGAPSQLLDRSLPTPQLADVVVWHCLRPILNLDPASSKDDIPATAHLHPDEVARLAAHHVFIRGAPSLHRAGAARAKQQWWDEEELMEAWSARIPSVPGGYEPHGRLLRGIAVPSRGGSDWTNRPGGARRWRYFPEQALPAFPSTRIKSMLAIRNAWTAEEAAPYLEKFVGAQGKGEDGVGFAVADLLGRHAKAVQVTEQDDNGEDVSVAKYVAMKG